MNIIETLSKNLKMNIDVEFGTETVVVRCDNKCRLLSHLFHRTGLDIHCTNQGIFEVPLEDFPEVIKAMDEIIDNPQWVIEFIEKYIDNEFMITSTFRPREVEVSQ